MVFFLLYTAGSALRPLAPYLLGGVAIALLASMGGLIDLGAIVSDAIGAISSWAAGMIDATAGALIDWLKSELGGSWL
jgi:hypothetical protein